MKWNRHIEIAPLNSWNSIKWIILGVVLHGIFMNGSVHATELKYPNNYDCPRIDSDFGSLRHHDGSKRKREHRGVDIGRNLQGYPVIASADGIVMVSGYLGINGRRVAIMHNKKKSHSGSYLFSLYSHLTYSIVVEGEEVKRGQEIGVIGNTGSKRVDDSPWDREAQYGSHLHFQVTAVPTAKFEVLPHLYGRNFATHKRELVDPDDYWLLDGVGKTPGFPMFDPDLSYQAETLILTYPVPCLNESEEYLLLK